MDALNSSRVYGRYLYYSDTKSPGNGHFEVYGCTGEIRSAKGYLILWHDGAGRLANAQGNLIARLRRWPRDLVKLYGLAVESLPGAVTDPYLQLYFLEPIRNLFGA